jgi:hypothetical protein
MHLSTQNYSSLSVIQRHRHALLEQLMRRAVQCIFETKEGLCLRFPKRNSTWMMLAEFVHLEQLSHAAVAYQLESGEFVDLHIKGSPEALMAAREHWQGL